MAKLPKPPGQLLVPTARELLSLGRDVLLWRVYFRGGPHPTSWDSFRHWGPVATARFDHHDPPSHLQGKGIYAAHEGPTALVEAFQDTRVIDRQLRRPWLVAFRLLDTLELLDLGGDWPTRAGASQGIATGRRDRAREWSRAIYDQLDVAGLHYPAALARRGHSVALYEQAALAMPSRPELHLPLDHPGLDLPLQEVARRFGYLMR